MCRNIKTLFNFEPPATEDEIRASALQFVRKLAGTNTPSRTNQPAFDRAVQEVTDAARHLLASLQTQAPPRDRATEMQKARERSKARWVSGNQRVLLVARPAVTRCSSFARRSSAPACLASSPALNSASDCALLRPRN